MVVWIDPYRFASSTSPLDTIRSLLSNFDHAYFAEGSAFEALGYSDTDPVSPWPDEVGSVDLTSSGGSRPTYLDGVALMNGKPALNFSTDYIGGTLSSAFTTAAASGWWEVVVAQDISLLSESYISDGNASSGRVIVGNGAGNNAIFAGSSLAGSSISSGMKGRAAKFAGASSQLFINGSADTSVGNTGSNVRSGLTIGMRWDRAGGAKFGGNIAFYGFWAGSDITAEPWWSDFVSAMNSHYGATLFA